MRYALLFIVCLLSCHVLAASENLLALDLSKQGPFNRQVRGWKTEKSEGDWLGHIWAFGAWDAQCLFELKLGQDGDGAKYLSLANLEGQPSLMFFTNVTNVPQGNAITAAFTYRTTGSSTGMFILGIGKQEEKINLEPAPEWKPVRCTVTARESGALSVNWRNLALGADKALQLKDLVVTTSGKPSSEFIFPERPLVQAPLRPVDLSKITGAKIDEAAVTTTLLVDATAKPGGDGSATRPFLLFADALKQAGVLMKAGTGVRIRLAPGVYREGQFEIRYPDEVVPRRAALIIEGAEKGKVVFSGADVMTGWKDEGDGLWSCAWPHEFGFFGGLMGQNNVQQLLGQRREMVYVDGVWQHPVILEDFAYTLKELDQAKITEGQHGGPQTHDPKGYWSYLGFKQPKEMLFPGSFGVAERSENGKRLWLRLAPGLDPNKQLVEAMARTQWARIAYKDNLVVRNLEFRHFGNAFFPDEGWSRSGAVQFGAPGQSGGDGHFQLHNILIEDCAVRWNSGGGLTLDRIQHLTVRRVDASHNGCGGMGEGLSHNMLFESCSTNFNNWRGQLGGCHGWAMAGIKFHEFRDAILRDLVSIGNLTGGLWWDVNCENFLVERPISVANNGLGVFFEISKGPMELSGAILSNSGTNLLLVCAEDVTLRNNIIWVPPAPVDSKMQVDANTGKISNSVSSCVNYLFYNRSSDKGDANWDVLGHELEGKPKTHRDFWLPGPVLAEGNVFSAGDNAYGMNCSIWLGPDIRRKELFDKAWVGRGNLWSSSGTPGFIFVDFDQPEKDPRRNTQLDAAGWSTRFNETAAVAADPQFTDPANFDFTVKPGSPLAGRSDLPLRKLPAAWLAELAAHQAWVKTLRPGKGWTRE